MKGSSLRAGAGGGQTAVELQSRHMCLLRVGSYLGRMYGPEPVWSRALGGEAWQR